jgi:hypothetical protein
MPADSNPPHSDSSRVSRLAGFGFAAQHWATAGLLGALFLALHLPLADGLRMDCPACSAGGALARDRSRPATAPDLMARPKAFAPLPILTGLPGTAAVLQTRPKAVAGEIEEAPAISDAAPGSGLPGMLATLAPFDQAPGTPTPRPSAVAGEIFTAPAQIGPLAFQDPFNTPPNPSPRRTVQGSVPSSETPGTPPTSIPSIPTDQNPPTEPPPPPVEPPPQPPAEPPPPPPPPPYDMPLPGSAWLLLVGLTALWAGLRKRPQARG